MQKNNDNKNENKVLENPETESMDKIREILFGNQIRDFDLKFNRLEEQVNKQLNDLQKDSSLRFTTLENFVKSEMQSLNQRIDTIVQQNQSAHSELRQLVLDQAKQIADQLSQQRQQEEAMIENFRAELESKKVDRSALSTLLTELALQISNSTAASPSKS